MGNCCYYPEEGYNGGKILISKKIVNEVKKILKDYESFSSREDTIQQTFKELRNKWSTTTHSEEKHSEEKFVLHNQKDGLVLHNQEDGFQTLASMIDCLHHKGAILNVDHFIDELARHGIDSVANLLKHSSSNTRSVLKKMSDNSLLHWVEKIIHRLVEQMTKWSKSKLEIYVRSLMKTPWSPINDDHIPKANTVAELRGIIDHAKHQGMKVRVCGAQHSVPGAIFDLSDASEKVSILKLQGDFMKIIALTDEEPGTFRVGGGCHLGIDVHDPISTAANSVTHVLNNAGWALPILGGMSHQTVAGYMSTSTAGGSMKFGWSDSLLEFDMMDANGILHTFRKGTDDFRAAGVSMGLMGIITSCKIIAVERFNVVGIEQTVKYENSVLANGKTWKNAFETNTYQHNVWYPNKESMSVLQFSAKKVPYTDPPPAEYKHPLRTEFMNVACWAAITLASKFDRESWYNVIGFIINLLNPVDTKPRSFNDFWWRALPNDDEAQIDSLIRIQFTEIWIDANYAEEVLTALRQLFKNPAACGNFGCEMYQAKKSPFWMSMSYGRDVIRIDPYWWEYNSVGTLQDYFTFFWDTLIPLTDKLRLHWGKHWPEPGKKFSGQDCKTGEVFEVTIGKDFVKQRYEKFDEWNAMRTRMDPDGVFLTKYWVDLLGI